MVEKHEYYFVPPGDMASAGVEQPQPARKWNQLPPLASKGVSLEESEIYFSPGGGLPLKYIFKRELETGWKIYGHKAKKHPDMVIRPVVDRVVRVFVVERAPESAWTFKICNLAGDRLAELKASSETTVARLKTSVRQVLLRTRNVAAHEKVVYDNIPSSKLTVGRMKIKHAFCGPVVRPASGPVHVGKRKSGDIRLAFAQ